MTIFLLHSLSSDDVEKEFQLNTLINITGDFYIYENDIPIDQRPVSYITVDTDHVADIINGNKTLPSNIGVKVKITIKDKIKKEQLIDDPVIDAYIKKYRLNHDNTIVVIWDQEHSINIHYIKTAAKKLVKQDMNIIIFNMNRKKHEHDNVTYIEGLSRQLILNISSQCKNHILIGNNMGLLCAKLTRNLQCVYPRPWKINDRNYSLNQEWYSVSYNWPSTKYFDHIYYINLNRRPDRRRHIEEQLSKFNLSGTRVQAADGKYLKWKKEYGIWSKTWNEGAFGCCLSHRQALTHARDNKFENILILEDDAILADNFIDVLEKAWNSLPEHWHMLYLSANHGRKGMPMYPTKADRISNNLFKLKGSYTTHAIILNKISFDIILNHLSAPYGPLDIFYSLYQKVFPCYVCNPGLASQMSGHSDIINTDVNYENRITGMIDLD